MGTSTRWPGPAGGAWKTPNRRLRELRNELSQATPGVGGTSAPQTAIAHADQMTKIVELCGTALRITLESDPDAFGLRNALLAGAANLVDVLDSLMCSGLDAFVLPADATAETRSIVFLRQFVDRVAGSGGTPADAILRIVAMHCARAISTEPPLRGAIQDANLSPHVRLSAELFCEIYRNFFGDFIGEFLRSVITAKIGILWPGPLMLDPSEEIANRIVRYITESIPEPCEETLRRNDTNASVTRIARELIGEAVERTLGLPTGDG